MLHHIAVGRKGKIQYDPSFQICLGLLLKGKWFCVKMVVDTLLKNPSHTILLKENLATSEL